MMQQTLLHCQPLLTPFASPRPGNRHFTPARCIDQNNLRHKFPTQKTPSAICRWRFCLPPHRKLITQRFGHFFCMSISDLLQDQHLARVRKFTCGDLVEINPAGHRTPEVVSAVPHNAIAACGFERIDKRANLLTQHIVYHKFDLFTLR